MAIRGGYNPYFVEMLLEPDFLLPFIRILSLY